MRWIRNLCQHMQILEIWSQKYNITLSFITDLFCIACFTPKTPTILAMTIYGSTTSPRCQNSLVRHYLVCRMDRDIPTGMSESDLHLPTCSASTRCSHVLLSHLSTWCYHFCYNNWACVAPVFCYHTWAHSATIFVITPEYTVLPCSAITPGHKVHCVLLSHMSVQSSPVLLSHLSTLCSHVLLSHPST